MPKTLKKSRLHSNKHKPKIKQEVILNRDYLENYHQQRFNLNNSDKIIDYVNCFF